MNRFPFSLCCALGLLAATVLASFETTQAAVKERSYTFDEAGATAGAQPAAVAPFGRRGVLDTQTSTTDYGGVDPPNNVNYEFVPLIGSGNLDRIPFYASAADRPGATAGNLGLNFDGVNDSLYNPNPTSATTPYSFDPRNFGGGRFEVISQAWVKPTSETFTTRQYVWRVGNENGGVVITANGKWAIRTGETAPVNEFFEVESNIAVQSNVWTHLAVLRGGNSSFLYVDGSVAAIDTGFWGGDGPEVRLGSNILAVGDDAFFKGIIDNFNIGTASDGTFNPTVDLDFFTNQNITFSGVTGDVDQDGVVNSEDYDIWSDNVGFNNLLGQGDPGTLLKGDVDQSGIVDFYDFQIINLAALNPPPAPSPGVPEPASVSLLLCGLVLVSLRRLRHTRSRAPLVAIALVAVALSLGLAAQSHATVVVADDFLYDGQSKRLHVGGGFDGFQQYRGGQNGAAGNWVGQWGQIGDGVITTPAFVPPIDPFNELPEPLPPFNVALYDGFFGVQSELFRDFQLAPSVSSTQTLYFGGKFKADLAIGTDGGTVAQFYAPRLFLNRIAGDDRDTDSDGIPLDPQRDRTQDIGVGFEDNMLVARLGAGPEVKVPVPALAPNDGNWHTIVGKFEVNAAGANERLTVWINPTGAESGGTTAQVEADVLPDLTTLIGTFHSQGTVPIDPDNPELGRSYIDDMAIGTAWQDVATVNIPRLTLRVSRADNTARLVNSTAATFQLNGYSIESEDGSLNTTGWNSLDEQNVGTWHQDLATTHQLIESNFLNSSTIAPNSFLPLGALFTDNADEDLTGRFTTLDGLVNLLNVEFVDSFGLGGDYNGNGIVDAADYTLWRNHRNQNFQLQNEGGISPGVVNDLDYAFWKSQFGKTSGAGSLVASQSPVPEPSAWLLSLLAVTAISALRRNRHQ